MTDINNNLGTDSLNKLHSVNFDGAKFDADFEIAEKRQEKEIKNLNNAHAALVGRSMIKPKSNLNFDKRIVGNIKADLAELESNPMLVTKADALFEAALAKGYSYDKATAMAKEFVDFHK